ncbi:hypothetical protein EJ02DRAFT_455482 [Clathrospora elynae]|uniref:Uncharacterized protein n=1 Tax=Clathrospora elynae TaxID=706981 RepID=A0A6A5SK88_9PLEO|nr:hypothetical protein EJ02DRAFT_455482 [Clathrospora elynae]
MMVCDVQARAGYSDCFQGSVECTWLTSVCCNGIPTRQSTNHPPRCRYTNILQDLFHRTHMQRDLVNYLDHGAFVCLKLL